MHASEGNLGVVVRLEHGLDGRADPDELARIAEEIAEHADVTRLQQLDEHHDVGAVILEGGMYGMPWALPAIDDAPPFDALPAHVEGEAGVTDPLRPPLPRAAAPAALNHQLAAARALPVWLVESVGLGHGRGHPHGQVVLCSRHGAATVRSPRPRRGRGPSFEPRRSPRARRRGLRW